MRLILDLDDRTTDLLGVLGDPSEVLGRLADHAQQGVSRPMAWERGWLSQVFGEEWREKLEPDPERPYNERPKQPGTP